MTGTPDTVFALPDLGEGLQEAEIVAWLVAEGDHVVADQPLVSVETDKAVVEIPSPRAGRIARLLAPIHAHVPVGAPLLAFVAEGAEQDTGTVVGNLSAPASRAPTRPPERPGVAQIPGGARMAPAVRALAASHGLDPATLMATGPDGTLTRADVEHAVAAAAPSVQPGMEPLRGVRRAMALRMAEAGAAVVAATITDEVDVQAWPDGTDITARLVVALVAACAAEPALNVAFDGKALARRMQQGVHVGVAVDTADGLFVPVLRDAQSLDPPDIRAAIAAMKAAVAARTVTPAQMQGASISLSNFGPLGGRFAALVVVPPQVAILGAGRVYLCAVPSDTGVARHRMLPLSLSFDHRVITGGEAARFLSSIKKNLETAS